mgnify:CR=1 FL=1
MNCLVIDLLDKLINAFFRKMVCECMCMVPTGLYFHLLCGIVDIMILYMLLFWVATILDDEVKGIFVKQHEWDNGMVWHVGELRQRRSQLLFGIAVMG